MFMPLNIAFGITIHRCQGMETGFDKDDRWNRIILDPGDIDWEIRMNLGTLYTSTSRGKTLGSKNVKYPKDSAIYWTGTGVSTDRLRNCRYKKSGQECESYRKRKAWVGYIEKKAEETKNRYNKDRVDQMTTNIMESLAAPGGTITDQTDLQSRITDIITNPNESWKKRKIDYLLPEDYFEDT